MTPQLKFLRRVRIHGGECGAVARALHHKAEINSLPAVSENVSFTTNERKQMSTKTTLKRIALVAVSALGFGLMATVPSNATNVVPTNISVGAATGYRVGTLSSQTVTFTLPSGTVAGDTVIVLARITSAPASSFATSKDAVPGTAAISSTAATDSSFVWAAATSGSGSYGTIANIVYNTAGDGLDATNNGGEQNWTVAAEYPVNASDSLTSISLRLRFAADAAGSYNILYAVGTPSSTSYDTSTDVENATTANLVANLTSVTGTITTTGTPTTATVSAVTTGAPVDGAAIYKVVLDSGLGSGETLVLSSNSSTVTFKSSTGAALTNNTITGTGLTHYFQVLNSAAQTATVTVTGGGLLSSSITSTANVTHTALTATLTTQPSFSLATDTEVMAATDTGSTQAGSATRTASTTAPNYSAVTTSASQAVKVTATAAEIVKVTVTDLSGKATGSANAVYDRAVTIGSAGTATFSVTATLLAGQSIKYVLTSTSTSARDVIITGRAATATTMTVSDDSRRTALLGSTTFSATVTDQYGAAMANQVVNVSVSGRNATASTVAYTTNSLGTVSHTVTDAGTTGLSDTVTFTHATATSVSDTGTITYGDATAGSVLVTTPNTTSTGVDEYPEDAEDISAGDGAEAGIKTVTALVKDAAGNVLSGMPVTWTITGDGCAILSTTVTGYTGAAGTDTASVYAWKNGTCTVTATSGGKSDSAPAIFAQETPTEARTIEATVSGNRITATVKDRFGNVILAATPVVATVTAGSGYFGSASSATANTDATTGQVTFVVSGGGATVKVGFESTTYGQSDALKGLIDGTTATNIFTAYTAGTALEAEEGVGASFDAAGVNSVTVQVTAADASVSAGNAATAAAEAATDAAAEAIDAANAATDAANLAAEAADAATVAAEGARDAADAATAAVEELATQVATLMAALKAQITTLANTVAKIAKKVKA